MEEERKKDNKPGKINYKICCIVIADLLILAVICDLYLMITNITNVIPIVIASLVCIAMTTILILCILGIMGDSKKVSNAYYNNEMKAQRALYLMMKKNHGVVESSRKETEDTLDALAREIVLNQKASSKIVVSRNKENTDALMNSNDIILEKILSMVGELKENKSAAEEQKEKVMAIASAVESNSEFASKQDIEAILAKLAEVNDSLAKGVPVAAAAAAPMPEAPAPEPMPEAPASEPMAAEPEPVAAEPVTEEIPIPEAPVAEEMAIPETPVAEEIPIPETHVAEEMPTPEVPAAEDIPIPEVPEMEAAPDLGDLDLGEMDLGGLDLGGLEETADVPDLGEMDLGGLDLGGLEGTSDDADLGDLDLSAFDLSGYEEEVAEEPVAAAVEPEPEPVAEEKPPMPDLSDPNKALSPDEIAAMFANMAPTEEAASEPVPEPEPEPIPEPVPEPAPAAEEKPPMPDLSDPNKQLSPDEIAAMFANMSPSEPAPEPAPEPEPAPVAEEKPPMPDLSDPNKQLSPEEIAAMFANMT
ncbi:MAG: hypothetical protein IK152_06455 [Lachnospiraceae bacterium]|nr:hypothetical protein [Lachnospiraceae bacterium]